MISLEDFLHSYGILAIVVGTFFEGETVLIMAGLAVHSGYLSLEAVVAAGFAGSFAGDQLYFQLGRRRGAAFLARRPAWEARVARARQFLQRHHVAFILGFRFLYGLRTVSPFAIGMSGVPPYRFMLLNGLGAIAWSVAVTLVGYSVGQGAEALLGRMKQVEAWLFLGIALLGATLWLVYFVRQRRAGGG